VGVELPVTALAASIEDDLIARGFADEDMSALARSIRSHSGL
jgi:3-hydroxyisobutyrate dehydrogenase